MDSGKDDLQMFNAKWLGMHFDGCFPTGIVSGLPNVRVENPEVQNLVNRMTSCFVQPSIPVAELIQLPPTLHSNEVVDTPSQSVFLNASLLKEWLLLARLKSKDVLAGHYLSLRHMHFEWSETEIYARMSNSDIHRISVRASTKTGTILRWAWPPNIFSGTVNVHPSVLGAWAFALTA